MPGMSGKGMEKVLIADLLIFGAGGHAKVASDCARMAYPNQILISGDDVEGEWNSVPILPQSSRSLEQWKMVCPRAFVAIGNGKIRKSVMAALEEMGFVIVTLLHHTAAVSPSARLEAGVLVCPQAVINADAHIGKGSIINTGAIAEHDCEIGDFSHLSPRAALGGGVVLGSRCWVCMGATVADHVMIGADTTIGAGAVVLDSFPGNVLAGGVPAKILKTYSA